MNLSNFAERLKELILDAGTNVTDLSIELGFANATISHYITGRYLPTVETVVRIANYFHCTTDYYWELSMKIMSMNLKLVHLLANGCLSFANTITFHVINYEK